MKPSEYAILMSVLWSNLIILLICLLRRQLWFIRIFSVRTILILYLGCLLRLFVNVEIRSAHEVNLPQLNVMGNLVNLCVGVTQTPIPVLLVTVWLTVSLILTMRLIKGYIKSYRCCKKFPVNSYMEKCLFDIVEPKHREKLSVITSSEISSPYITGLGRSTICLPERKWEKKKLYTILEHEYTHYKNHDLLTILLVDIFTAFFWWNLPVYLLRSHVSDILEFKVDESVLKNCKPSDARFYCKTLIEFARRSNSKSARGFAASVIESRISRILNQNPLKIHKTIFSAVLLIAAFSTFLCSYLFILQPAYQPPPLDFTEIPVDRSAILSDSEGAMYAVVNGKKYFVSESQKQLILQNDKEEK